jgi:hypothetical protein
VTATTRRKKKHSTALLRPACMLCLLQLHCFSFLWREPFDKGESPKFKRRKALYLTFLSSHKQIILIDSPKYLARSRAGSESGKPRSTRDCFLFLFFVFWILQVASSHYRDGFFAATTTTATKHKTTNNTPITLLLFTQVHLSLTLFIELTVKKKKKKKKLNFFHFLLVQVHRQQNNDPRIRILNNPNQK